MTVTVRKLGGSVAVIIPKAIATEIELTAGATLRLTVDDGKIVLRKQSTRRRRPISEIVAEINPVAYRRRNREFSKDRPVGKELW